MHVSVPSRRGAYEPPLTHPFSSRYPGLEGVPTCAACLDLPQQFFESADESLNLFILVGTVLPVLHCLWLTRPFSLSLLACELLEEEEIFSSLSRLCLCVLDCLWLILCASHSCFMIGSICGSHGLRFSCLMDGLGFILV